MNAVSSHALTDQRALRRANLSNVLSVLRDGPRSRARLAEDLGLNKATVSSLVSELIERRLAREGSSERGSVGRPGTVIELDGEAVCGVAAEVNVNHVATLAVNLRGEVLSERRTSVAAAGQPPNDVLELLSGLLGDTLADVKAAGAAVTGIVVGVAGLVERNHGNLTIAPNLGWSDVPVSALLGDLLGAATADRPVPIEVHNEATLAVVAEARSAEPDERDIIVVHSEIGIGGGIFADGRRFDGARGYAGEFGHMVVDPSGRRCGCGRTGCWETTIGLNRLLELVAEPGDSLLAPALGLEERIAEIDRRAETGDDRTLAALDEIARWLARGAAILTNVLNPGAIVLGGYLALLGHRLLDVLVVELEAAVIAPDTGGTRVAISSLGFTASVHGGAVVALDRIFDDPTVVSRNDELGAIS